MIREIPGNPDKKIKSNRMEELSKKVLWILSITKAYILMMSRGRSISVRKQVPTSNTWTCSGA